MKKSTIYWCLGLMIIGGACAGNAKNEAQDSASVGVAAVADSANSAEAGEEAQKEEPAAEVITDAICLDAKGNISQIRETVKEGLYESITTYGFDKEGQLVSMTAEDTDGGPDGTPLKVKRDDKGRPTAITMSVSDDMGEDQDYTISFTYNGENLLTKENHESYDATWTNAYTRDDEGRIKTLRRHDGLSPDVTYTVSYPEGAIDEKGNWTKRTLKTKGETTTYTRKITYRN